MRKTDGLTRGGAPPSRKPGPRPTRTVPTPAAPPPTHICEAEVAEGLERIAWSEIRGQFDDRAERLAAEPGSGVVRFAYTGNLFHLLKLKTVQAAYLSRTHPVPRPKGLLGDQHFKALLGQIAAARELSPADAYRTLRISAAGSDSSVMTRLKRELAAQTGLEADETEGDLLIRVRPARGEDGWETLVRLSPRPLATRSWRVCNREGALNAAVASAMALLTGLREDDVFVNLLCGSGTLLIERLAAGPVGSATGYDLDPRALECARKNIEAAGYADRIALKAGDATDLDLPDRSADVVAADLPFGQLVGSHEENMILYPALLKEAGRVTKPGGRGVFITHEVRLMEAALAESRWWKPSQVLKIGLGGMHPRIYVLERG